MHCIADCIEELIARAEELVSLHCDLNSIQAEIVSVQMEEMSIIDSVTDPQRIVSNPLTSLEELQGTLQAVE